VSPAKRPNKWTPVEVVWADAWVDSDSHNVEDSVAKFEGCVRRTLGYFVAERYVSEAEVKYMFIAETDDRKALMGNQNGERLTAIPSSMVIDLNSLRKNNVAEPAPAQARTEGS